MTCRGPLLALLPALSVLSLLLAATVGCHRRPDIRGLDETAIILTFGDSLTQGIGTDTKLAYPAVLARLTGRTVINGGRSGETTRQGLLRLQEVFKDHGPSLTILCEGGNDFLQGIPEAETEANLGHMVRFLKNNGSDVILIGVPRPRIPLRTAAFYRTLARQHNVPIEDDILGTLMSTPSMKHDELHLNDHGYAALARAVATIIEESQQCP